MDNKRVVVTGLGAVTPIGLTVEEYWNGLVNGANGAAEITRFDHSAHKTHFACEVKEFEPTAHFSAKDARKLDRFIQFGMVAAREAFKSSGLDIEKQDPTRIGVIVGSGIGGLAMMEQQAEVLMNRGPAKVSPLLVPMMIANMVPGQISMDLGLKGPNSCVVTACATGTHSIGDAFNVIRRGQADAMVCGGAEAAISPIGVAGFENMRALSSRNDSPATASRPFDKERDGFVIGEGAGVIVLEEYEQAKARGANILAEIVGYGMTGDAYHMTAPAPGGEGAARSMQMCLDDARLDPAQVNHINAHGTSTPMNDKNETAAIKTVFGDHAKSIAVTSNKSMIGHLLGAAGGVEAIASVLAITRGVVPPTINYTNPDPECDLDYTANAARELAVNAVISNSLGFGGHNTTIAFRKI